VNNERSFSVYRYARVTHSTQSIAAYSIDVFLIARRHVTNSLRLSVRPFVILWNCVETVAYMYIISILASLDPSFPAE